MTFDLQIVTTTYSWLINKKRYIYFELTEDKTQYLGIISSPV